MSIMRSMNLVRGRLRGIDFDRVVRTTQRGHGPAAIPRVAIAHLGKNVDESSRAACACNSKVRRCARVSRLAIRKNFAWAAGKTTVPTSRPSATTLAWVATRRCMSSSPARTSGSADTRDAPSEISGLRMSSVTSRESARMRVRSLSRTKTISSALASAPSPAGHRPRESAALGHEGDRAIERARVEKGVAKAIRQGAGHGGLAGAGGTVDCNYEMGSWG
jgi:hypothetical protein